MADLAVGGICLAVQHAFARAHHLDLTGQQHAAVAHAVFMLERALDEITENLHVTVRMRGETAAWGDAVLIDHPQRAKAHVCRVIVVGEAEGVIAVEPAVVGMAAFFGSAKCGFHNEKILELNVRRRQCGDVCLRLHDGYAGMTSSDEG